LIKLFISTYLNLKKNTRLDFILVLIFILVDFSSPGCFLVLFQDFASKRFSSVSFFEFFISFFFECFVSFFSSVSEFYFKRVASRRSSSKRFRHFRTFNVHQNNVTLPRFSQLRVFANRTNVTLHDETTLLARFLHQTQPTRKKFFKE